MSKRDCDTCQGTGIIYIWDPCTKKHEATTCPVCKGTGKK